MTLHTGNHHITVCICTFKRAHLLPGLLESIESLVTEGLFTVSICIVDNDVSQSAREVVTRAMSTATVPIQYTCEPEQNIALARNRAVENAESSHIAFIDDDEIPEQRWLLLLYQMWRETGASGVLGPVLPRFQSPPPAWIVKARVLERPEKRIGERLNWVDTRTGNVLFDRRLFDSQGYRFNSAYGRGGEDRELFRRMIANGESFVWCSDAIVRELIPASRCSRLFQLRRALLRGKAAMPTPFRGFRRLMKSSMAVFLYVFLLPLLLVFSDPVFMRYFIRMCDHLGTIMAFFGFNIIRERYLS